LLETRLADAQVRRADQFNSSTNAPRSTRSSSSSNSSAGGAVGTFDDAGLDSLGTADERGGLLGLRPTVFVLALHKIGHDNLPFRGSSRRFGRRE
jgi:hypothetical protein